MPIARASTHKGWIHINISGTSPATLYTAVVDLRGAGIETDFGTFVPQDTIQECEGGTRAVDSGGGIETN